MATTRRYRVELRLGRTDLAVSIQECATPEEALASHIASEVPDDGEHLVVVTSSGQPTLRCLVTLRHGMVLAVTAPPMAAA